MNADILEVSGSRAERSSQWRVKGSGRKALWPWGEVGWPQKKPALQKQWGQGLETWEEGSCFLWPALRKSWLLHSPWVVGWPRVEGSLGTTCSSKELPLLQELWVPVMETRGTFTSLCCLSHAIHSLQSNSGPAFSPCTEDKMKATAKSAAGIILPTTVFPLLLKSGACWWSRHPYPRLLSSPHFTQHFRWARQELCCLLQ